MTRDESLSEAKRKYPIGTRFIGAKYGVEGIVVKTIYTFDGDDISVKADRPSEGAKESGTYIYCGGKWAEILSRPEPVIINDYQIY